MPDAPKLPARPHGVSRRTSPGDRGFPRRTRTAVRLRQGPGPHTVGNQAGPPGSPGRPPPGVHPAPAAERPPHASTGANHGRGIDVDRDQAAAPPGPHALALRRGDRRRRPRHRRRVRLPRLRRRVEVARHGLRRIDQDAHRTGDLLHDRAGHRRDPEGRQRGPDRRAGPHGLSADVHRRPGHLPGGGQPAAPGGRADPVRRAARAGLGPRVPGGGGRGDHRLRPGRDPQDAAVEPHRGLGSAGAAGGAAGRLRDPVDGPLRGAAAAGHRVPAEARVPDPRHGDVGGTDRCLGAMAAVVGETGLDALKSLAVIMIGFYVTCALFVFVVLGLLLRVVARVNVFSLLKYLGREFLLILSTSSSETALPRLIAKMEHAGVSQPVAGIVVPTGYSFNLDGTAIYLTMASLFIAEALDDPLSISEQIGLLAFMIIASKGAAGVTGAGLATLAGGLSAHRPELLDGVGLIVGIDRFMSEARALTTFAGNAIATVLVATWTSKLDRNRLSTALSGEAPFDEATMLDDDHGDAAPDVGSNAGPGQRDAESAARDLATRSPH